LPAVAVAVVVVVGAAGACPLLRLGFKVFAFVADDIEKKKKKHAQKEELFFFFKIKVSL
jgi:hypothetical protein